MLGQIQEWFYHDLAGIQNAPGSAGFKQIVINPQPVGDVTWVRASYNSRRGKIVSNWKRDGAKLTLDVTIPANTTATVFVPATSAGDVTESGKSAAQSPGVSFLRMENGRAVFAIESGEYKFRSRQATRRSGRTDHFAGDVPTVAFLASHSLKALATSWPCASR